METYFDKLDKTINRPRGISSVEINSIIAMAQVLGYKVKFQDTGYVNIHFEKNGKLLFRFYVDFTRDSMKRPMIRQVSFQDFISGRWQTTGDLVGDVENAPYLIDLLRESL